MTDGQISILVLLVLLVVDALAIAARASFIQTSHARLLALRESLGEQISRTEPLLHSLPRLKASLNFILVLARFSLAGLTLYWISRLSFIQTGSLVVTILLLLLAGFVLFWYEWVIEKAATQTPEVWAVRFTPLVKVVMVVCAPLLALPLGISHDTQPVDELPGLMTEDELKSLVDAGQEEGLFERGERQMIYSIFQLGDTLAREIMVPRIDMLALDALTPLPEAVDALLRSGHSRVPVFEETVDNTLGLLYAKDLLRLWREGTQIESLRDLLRPAYFVPEAKRVDNLLTEMQSQRIHMAIVVDEYGGVAGLVTLEDIVEEILGEIRDEYDQAEESPYQLMKNGDYVFQGRVDLDDFNEIMGSELSKDEADTLGGYFYSRIGRVPEVGETVQKENLLLTVEQVSGRQIRKVRARWLPVNELGEEDQNGNNT